MYPTMKGRIFIAVLVLGVLVVAQMACGLSANQEAESSGPSAPVQPGGSGETQKESDAPGQGEGSESMGDEGESPIEPEFESDHLSCPPKGTLLLLGFDHALTINIGETSITHTLTEGWVNLEVADDHGTLMSVGQTSLDYFMEGMMSKECTLESQGTMIPTAQGSCENGVVSLFIEENWLPLEGQMVCIDEDGEVDIVPFNVPPMGKQTHSGQNGEGEIFYLVAGSEGYSSMRPFLEGDGYHTWTLYMVGEDDMPPVPLVP